MKIKLSVIAALTLSSQLVIAEDTAPAAADVTSSPATIEVTRPADKAASESQIKALKTSVTPSLQSKLEKLMSFEPEPASATGQAVASAN